MTCYYPHCNKPADYVITTKGRTLDSEIAYGHMYCLKHARTVFRNDCVCVAEVVVRLWKVDVIDSNGMGVEL